MDNTENVHLLAFVLPLVSNDLTMAVPNKYLVNAFDLDIKKRVRVHRDGHCIFDVLRQANLVRELNVHPLNQPISI